MTSEPAETPEGMRALTPDVIEELVSGHAGFLAFLSRRLPSRSVAEDLLQQCMQRAMEKLPQLEDEEKITAWFYRILRNALIDYYRSRGAEDRRLKGYLDQLIQAGESFEHAPDEVRTAVCACLTRLLPTLHAPYADLIQKIDLDGQNPQDLAARLGTTPGTLAVRLHRARRALRKSLELSCGSCAEHGCLHCDCK